MRLHTHTHTHTHGSRSALHISSTTQAPQNLHSGRRHGFPFSPNARRRKKERKNCPSAAQAFFFFLLFFPPLQRLLSADAPRDSCPLCSTTFPIPFSFPRGTDPLPAVGRAQGAQATATPSNCARCSRRVRVTAAGALAGQRLPSPERAEPLRQCGTPEGRKNGAGTETRRARRTRARRGAGWVPRGAFPVLSPTPPPRPGLSLLSISLSPPPPRPVNQPSVQVLWLSWSRAEWLGAFSA